MSKHAQSCSRTRWEQRNEARLSLWWKNTESPQWILKPNNETKEIVYSKYCDAIVLMMVSNRYRSNHCASYLFKSKRNLIRFKQDVVMENSCVPCKHTVRKWDCGKGGSTLGIRQCLIVQFWGVDIQIIISSFLHILKTVLSFIFFSPFCIKF